MADAVVWYGVRLMNMHIVENIFLELMRFDMKPMFLANSKSYEQHNFRVSIYVMISINLNMDYWSFNDRVDKCMALVYTCCNWSHQHQLSRILSEFLFGFWVGFKYSISISFFSSLSSQMRWFSFWFSLFPCQYTQLPIWEWGEWWMAKKRRELCYWMLFGNCCSNRITE